MVEVRCSTYATAHSNVKRYYGWDEKLSYSLWSALGMPTEQWSYMIVKLTSNYWKNVPPEYAEKVEALAGPHHYAILKAMEINGITLHPTKHND